MLRNFVRTNDLVKYDVAIEQYLPEGQEDWSAQIGEAFEHIKDKLRQKNLDCRLMGLPLDLNRVRTSSDKETALTELTKNSFYSGGAIEGINGFRRLVLDVRSLSGAGDVSFSIEGSNDVGVPVSEEPTNWVCVHTFPVSSTGEVYHILQDEFPYYRISLSVGEGENSVCYRAGIYETYQDRWISFLALSLIYRMISKGVEDVWIRKSQEMYSMFEESFEYNPFVYDTDRNNLPDKKELHSGTIRFFR